MNVLVFIEGEEVTDACVLDRTRLNFDVGRRITTGSITLAGPSPGAQAHYDDAFYDEDRYALAVNELETVQILDGRDRRIIFSGRIFSIDISQTDASEQSTYYTCELNDHAAWLDRAVCWDDQFQVPMPSSDHAVIVALVTRFCPRITTVPGSIAQLLPTLMAYEWIGKTCRQVLEDMSSMSGGEWFVDTAAELHYGAGTDAPEAPFDLSTEPDMANTFPVRIDSWKRDFTNPINRAFVRGQFDETGVAVQAEYADPVSIQKYGEYSYSLIDDQIINTFDAELKAKTTVLKYAYPVEQGTFTIWKDDLAVGQMVHITERTLGIDGEFIIRALSMAWKGKWEVEYTAQFGASQPDLETYLRQLDQRSRWKSALPPPIGEVDIPPGSIEDIHIKQPGLSAGSINSVSSGAIIGTINAGQIASVNASSIVGQINAGQIGTINAGQITGQLNAGQIGAVNSGVIVGQLNASQIGSVNASSISGVISSSQIGSISADKITGAITAGQIASVNAGSIQGVISAGQIGSVAATSITGVISAGQVGSINAGVIQGVIVTSQLANQIIDDLGKFANAMRPIPLLDDTNLPLLPNVDWPPGSRFYYVPNGWFYEITPNGLSWTNITTDPNALTGQLKVYSIGKINATSIIGLIAAGQIGSINATSIVGTISASQIGSVRADQITGSITAGQIANLTAAQITGQLQAYQIATVTAGQITGQITAGQIASVTASTIQGAITAAQISTVNATSIQGVITASQIASVNAGSIVGAITGGQITSISAGQISGQIVAGQIANINAGTITIGLIVDGQISTLNGGKIVAGTIDSAKLNATAINVGGAGNMPGVFQVYDAGGSIVGRIGLMTGGYYGGWFKVFGAGGTTYADAIVKTDLSGNVSIGNATITITSGTSKLDAGPAIFSPVYNSLAWRVTQGSPVEESLFVSRGIASYYNGSLVCSLVRSPSTPSAGELAIYSGGTMRIFLDGVNGLCRAVGFQTNSLVGVTASITTGGGGSLAVAGGIITSYVNGSGSGGGGTSGHSGSVALVDGASINFSNGLATAAYGATITKITKQINVARPGSGYWELYFNNGLLSGYIERP